MEKVVQNTKKKVWERMVNIKNADREFDIVFWQSQKPEVRFRTAFDMIKDYYRIKGKKIDDNTFRLQRFVEHLKQASG